MVLLHVNMEELYMEINDIQYNENGEIIDVKS